MRIRVVIAALGALALGLAIGAWVVREGEFDSRDLVTLVSILGTIAVSIYATYASGQRERDRQVHDRKLQSERLIEERARLGRERAVEDFAELKEQLVNCRPTDQLLTKLAETHPEDQHKAVILELTNNLTAAMKAEAKTTWLRMLGWTPEIREASERLSELLNELVRLWLDAIRVYVMSEIDDVEAAKQGLFTCWDSIRASGASLEQLIRDS